MNFTGGNTLPNIGRRINWQLVTLTGGLALVISAGALAGAFDRGERTATTPPSQSRIETGPASRSSTLSSPEIAYFIVGSKAEAALLASVFSTEAAHLGVSVGGPIVAVTSAEEEAEAYATIALAASELMSLNTGVSIVDLRPAPAATLGLSQDEGARAPTVYIVGTPEGQTALEQRLAEAGETASVLVIEAGTLQGDQMYNTLVGEQMEFGNFNVLDLR